MVPVKIEKVSAPFSVKTQYGDKSKVEVACKELSTNTKYEATMFVPKDGLNFKEGDEVLADIQINGQYVNIKKVEKIGVPPPPPKVEPKNGNGKYTEDEIKAFEDRDRRMCRMNALAHGVEVVKMMPMDGLEESEIANMVMMAADLFVEYIYKK